MTHFVILQLRPSGPFAGSPAQNVYNFRRILVFEQWTVLQYRNELIVMMRGGGACLGQVTRSQSFSYTQHPLFRALSKSLHTQAQSQLCRPQSFICSACKSISFLYSTQPIIKPLFDVAKISVYPTFEQTMASTAQTSHEGFSLYVQPNA